QEVARLAQGNAEVGAAIAREQTGARPDVGAGQFQVAAALAGALTAAAAINVAAIAMPFQLGFGDVGHDVVFKLAGGFEVGAATMRALLRVDVVLDQCGIGGRFGPEDARVLAMLLAAAVGRRSLPQFALALGSLAALEELLDLMLELRDAPAQLGVLGFEFGNPLVARVIHDPHSMPKTAEIGKSSCLTVTKN